MYRNVFGEKVSKKRYKEMLNAAKNRRELIAADLTSRRDLFKMGLLTAGGMLVAKSGLSARALGQTQTKNPPSSGSNTSPGTNQLCVPGNQTASPATTPFIDPLPVMPVVKKVTSLTPTPTTCPNVTAGEVRAACHQATQLDASRFPIVPATLYNIHQRQFRSGRRAIHACQRRPSGGSTTVPAPEALARPIRLSTANPSSPATPIRCLT